MNVVVVFEVNNPFNNFSVILGITLHYNYACSHSIMIVYLFFFF